MNNGSYYRRNKFIHTDERVDDRVGALIVGGANITATYNDAAGTPTIDADNIGDVTGVTAGAGLTGGGTQWRRYFRCSWRNRYYC